MPALTVEELLIISIEFDVMYLEHLFLKLVCIHVSFILGPLLRRLVNFTFYNRDS